MVLTVLERIGAMGIIPQTGDVIFLRLRKDLIKKLSFNEDEMEAINLRIEGDKYRWDSEVEVDFDFSEAEFGILKEELLSRNKLRTLTEDHLTLYEKIVEQK